MFRLAYILTAAMPGMLPKISLTPRPTSSCSQGPKKYADLLGERVDKRDGGAGGQLGRTAKVEVT